MSEATCRTCRFWRFAGCTMHDGYHAGACRRRSPDGRRANHLSNEGTWPHTSERDWCGEHEPAHT